MSQMMEFKFEIQSKFTLSIPSQSKIVGVQLRNGVPTLLVHARAESAPEEMRFTCVKTGQAIEYEYVNYVGTLQIQSGLSIWHVFQEIIIESKPDILPATAAVI